MVYYNSSKPDRYNRAVNRKIVTASIAKNRRLATVKAQETASERVKWEALLNQLISEIEDPSEREKRAIEIWVAYDRSKNPQEKGGN
jgi:hypothetical protein